MTLRVLFWYLGHHFGDHGSRGAPNGHTEAQMAVFINFKVDLGSLLGPTLGTIL